MRFSDEVGRMWPGLPDHENHEDIVMGEHLWTLVGDNIQYGDFGGGRTVYYDRKSRDTQIEPRHILLHPLKTPEECAYNKGETNNCQRGP
jgi:hypothetical protein